MNFSRAYIRQQGVLTPWKQIITWGKISTRTLQQGVLTPWKHHKHFTFFRQQPPQIRLLAVLW